MADDDTSKTEEPTDNKLKKARQQGNVPKSEDLNGFMGVLFAVIIGFVMSLIYPDIIVENGATCLDTLWFYAVKGYSLTPDCITFAETMRDMAYAMFVGMIFAAFLGYFIMNKGFVISKQPLKLNMNALNIGENIKNLVRKENVVGTAISIVKESLFYGVFSIMLIFFLPIMVYESFCFLNCKGVTPLYYVYLLIACYTFIAFIFALIDYPLKIRFWKDKLKMSHKDIKDEHKEMEGSPEIKRAQNDFRWEMLNGTPTGPKNATFFVRGATTIWGIRYNREESPAPIVVAIGKNPEQANKISRIAQQMRRLVIADDEFTRLLAGKAVMGRPVPLEYVVNVRRCIMELRKHEEQFGPTHPPKK
ncbi:MAG: EscU/YscU/HrcU family type III secretion system export apparatus switch protein [Pseudomonadota bacterium]